MTEEYLRKYVVDKIKSYPNFKEEIMDFYHLCLDEIDEGGSVENEINSCINDIEELINP